MSDYKEIKGKTIQSLGTDPSDTGAEGQVWYNSAAGAFKSVVVGEAWSSAAPIISARGFAAATGTQTASLIAGGLDTSSSPTIRNKTEEYNGSGWSAGGNLPTDTYGAGAAGTQTAALFFGGGTPGSPAQVATSLTYDGSTWTATPNSMNTARDQVLGGGTQTSALAVGGRLTSPGSMVTNFEEWNGTSWSNLTAISTARGYTNANGPETAFFIAGGATGTNGGQPYTSATEEYDGTSLSTGGNINVARAQGGAAGDSTAGLIFGGRGGPSDSNVLNTESYDGSTWTTSSNLASEKRGIGAGSGTTNSAAIAAGNYGPPSTGPAEEYNKSVNVITGAAWASGGNLSTGRYELGTVGTQTAGLAFGGNRAVNAPTGIRTETEEYNGTSWTSGGALPAAKATQGFGVQTAAVTVGGTVAPNPTAGSTTEEYNGTSWTSGNSLNTATVAMAASTGLESAGLRAGGGSTPASRLSAVEEYDGTSWASVTSLPSTRFQFQGTGPQTAAFFTGGNTAPPTQETTDSLDYNGSTWTAGPTMVFGMRLHGVSGNSNTSNLSFGGEPTIPGRSSTQSFDGTGFVTAPSLGTGRSDLGGCGTASASLAVGGNNAPSYDLVNTEEFTGETSVLNIKTLTTS